MARAQRLPADPAGPAARRIGRKTGVREDCPSRKTDTGYPTARHTVRRTSSRCDCRRCTEGTSCRASTGRRKQKIEISSLVHLPVRRSIFAWLRNLAQFLTYDQYIHGTIHAGLSLTWLTRGHPNGRKRLYTGRIGRPGANWRVGSNLAV